jgi:hypothetical protein
MNALKKVLDNYRGELETKNWDDDLWNKFRCKMDFIIENCKGNNNKKSNSKIDLKKEL